MIKAIIFDIDGVLLDSFEANFDFFKNLMTAAGYEAPTREEYMPLFHRTMYDTVKILTKTEDDKEIQRICDMADVVDAISPVLSPGAAKAIEELSTKYTLGIVTSRNRAYVFESPLDTLEKFFKISVAYEDTETHKPNPEPLLLAARLLGVAPEECVYVGDVESDLQAARAAGMKFVLYSTQKLEGVDGYTKEFETIFEVINSF